MTQRRTPSGIAAALLLFYSLRGVSPGAEGKLVYERPAPMHPRNKRNRRGGVRDLDRWVSPVTGRSDRYQNRLWCVSQKKHGAAFGGLGRRTWWLLLLTLLRFDNNLMTKRPRWRLRTIVVDADRSARHGKRHAGRVSYAAVAWHHKSSSSIADVALLIFAPQCLSSEPNSRNWGRRWHWEDVVVVVVVYDASINASSCVSCG
jgi:hypothetical protein